MRGLIRAVTRRGSKRLTTNWERGGLRERSSMASGTTPFYRSGECSAYFLTATKHRSPWDELQPADPDHPAGRQAEACPTERRSQSFHVGPDDEEVPQPEGRSCRHELTR